MRIIEPKYKLGQKVGCVNLDNPNQILPCWVIGIDLANDGRSIEYTLAETYDEYGFKKFNYICDGVKEGDLRDEDYINS
jgi:hypothetical protein